MAGTSLDLDLTTGAGSSMVFVPSMGTPVGSVYQQLFGSQSKYLASYAPLDPATGTLVQPIGVGAFDSAEQGFDAVNLRAGTKLRWRQDPRNDGVVSFTGFA
jgi:hypothetical protein